MTPTYEMTTRMVWRDENGKRRVTVEHYPYGDMQIKYEVDGVEDQILDLDEHAWHAIYAMMGEVK